MPEEADHGPHDPGSLDSGFGLRLGAMGGPSKRSEGGEEEVSVFLPLPL